VSVNPVYGNVDKAVVAISVALTDISNAGMGLTPMSGRGSRTLMVPSNLSKRKSLKITETRSEYQFGKVLRDVARRSGHASR